MLSPRFVVVCGFALLAAVVAHPAPDRSIIPPPMISMTEDDFAFPWMSISPFSLFAPLWKLIPSFAEIGPRIYNDNDKFQVVVNVKDYRKEDLKVKTKADLIIIQGSQEANNNNRDVFATHFFHTYSLPSNSSSLLITAKLTADGFLVITAPIAEDIDNSKDVDRDVPIVETGAPYRREEVDTPKEEVTSTTEVVGTTTQTPTTNQPTTTSTPEPTTTQTTTTTQTPTTTEAAAESEAPITNPQPTPTTSVPSTLVVEEEPKEPTPSPERDEDATEKDNVIPHGNEATP